MYQKEKLLQIIYLGSLQEFFSSASLIEEVQSTGQNDKMLYQCFMMLFSGQEPNLLRHNEEAMTKCP